MIAWHHCMFTAEHQTMTTVLRCCRPSTIHSTSMYSTNVLPIFHRLACCCFLHKTSFGLWRIDNSAIHSMQYWNILIASLQMLENTKVLFTFKNTSHKLYLLIGVHNNNICESEVCLLYYLTIGPNALQILCKWKVVYLV